MPFLAYRKFYLAFWVSFDFKETDFHKIKGRETLSRSQINVNTTDNKELTESFSLSTDLDNVCMGIKNFVFKISFDLKKNFLPHLVKTVCNKFVNKAGLMYYF
jgi:hypothetical protein